jgi:hypothetical protein
MRKLFLLRVCVLLISTAFFPARLTAQPPLNSKEAEVIDRLVEIQNSIRELKTVCEQSLQSAVPQAPADPDYIKLLQQRVEVAKCKIEAPRARAESGTGSRAAYEDAKLALAEAEYALKKAQQRFNSPAQVPPQSQASTDPDYIKLFQQRRAIAIEKFRSVEAKSSAGAKGGEPEYYYNAQIAVADAEVALYRVTGEKEKVRLALEQKLKWTKMNQEYFETADASGSTTREKVLDAKTAAIEAEIELKQATATPVGATTAPAASGSSDVTRPAVQREQIESSVRDCLLHDAKLVALRAKRKMLQETIKNLDKIPPSVIMRHVQNDSEFQRVNRKLDELTAQRGQFSLHLKPDDPRLQQMDNGIADLEKEIEGWLNGSNAAREKFRADTELKIWDIDMQIRSREIEITVKDMQKKTTTGK